MWLHCISVCYDLTVNGQFVTDGQSLEQLQCITSYGRVDSTKFNYLSAAFCANSVVTRSS